MVVVGLPVLVLVVLRLSLYSYGSWFAVNGFAASYALGERKRVVTKRIPQWAKKSAIVALLWVVLAEATNELVQGEVLRLTSTFPTAFLAVSEDLAVVPVVFLAVWLVQHPKFRPRTEPWVMSARDVILIGVVKA